MYDAMMLRKVATLAGVATPESDETLLNCMGSILSKVYLNTKKAFDNNVKLKATLKEVSGCYDDHNTPKLCVGCIISINRTLKACE